MPTEREKMKHRGIAIVANVILLCFFASPCHAYDEKLLVSQSSTGEVIVELDGFQYTCGAISQFGKTTVSQTGSAFLVTTLVPIPSPQPCPPEALMVSLPYKLVADLGSLPDGNYTVAWAWSVVISNPPPPHEVTNQAFRIRSGLLVVPSFLVPTLNEFSMIIFVTLLGLASLHFLRRQRKAR
jgi:hypothetical protein